MKFTMNSDIEFEAESPDDALLKLGLYFIAQMDNRPILAMHSNEDLSDAPLKLDVVGMLESGTAVMTDENVSGNTFIAMKGVFSEPKMLQ